MTRVQGKRFGNQSNELAEMREARHLVSPLRARKVAAQLVVEGHGYVHTFGEVGAFAPDTRHSKVAGVALVPCSNTGSHRELFIN
jgi:hypothetical protein